MESSTFEIKVATSLSKHILFCFQELERNSGHRNIPILYPVKPTKHTIPEPRSACYSKCRSGNNFSGISKVILTNRPIHGGNSERYVQSVYWLKITVSK